MSQKKILSVLEQTQKLYRGFEQIIDEGSEMDALLMAYTRSVARSLNARRVSLMVLDEESQELVVRASEGLESDIKTAARIKRGQGIAGWVAEKGEGILIRNITRNKQFKGEKKKRGFRSDSFICMPIKVRSKVYAVLNVAEKSSAQEFTADELKTLQLFAMQMSVLLENYILKKEIEELRQKTAGEVAEISHDFRIPLTCVQEALRMMSDGKTGNLTKQQEDFAELAKRNLIRMLNTFDALIDVTTNMHGNLRRSEKVDINALLEELEQSFWAKAQSKGVTIETAVPKEGCFVISDGKKIYDVMMNLLDNAIKYTRKDTSVVLSAGRKARRVRIQIKDQGPGISIEDQKILFDRAANIARNKRKKNPDGHGLGLSISKEIIEWLGGRIGVESDSDQGAVFFIELPEQPGSSTNAPEKEKMDRSEE